jgi:Sulfotransferase family
VNDLKQVFIVGMNGSGTTMLLEHLANHPKLFGFPTETRFLPYFVRNEGKYGDLADDANYLRLWTDMSRLVGHAAVGDPRQIIERESRSPGPRSAAAVFDRLMSRFAVASGKQAWCEKSPMYVLHLALLGHAFPEARFIHIIRDGRDCAASFHRRWRFHPIRTIYRWKKAVSAGRVQGGGLGARYREVRYEEVTASPEHEFREICEFLGIEFEPSILVTARPRSEMSGSSSNNVVLNVRSFKEYFPRGELERMERVAGRYLTELGYACDNSSGDDDPPSSALRWWQFKDDLRRLCGVAFSKRRLLRPGNWPYVVRRVRRHLKQRAGSRP